MRKNLGKSRTGRAYCTARLVQQKEAYDSDVRRLVKRGLLKPNVRGAYDFFSPIFENYVKEQIGSPVEAPPATDKAEPLPEFPPEKPRPIKLKFSGSHAVINGKPAPPLTGTEYAIFHAIAAQPKTSSVTELIQVMHLARARRTVLESQRFAGGTVGALYQ